MNCEYCGTKLFKADRCCPKCGAPIEVADSEYSFVQNYNEVYSTGSWYPMGNFTFTSCSTDMPPFSESGRTIRLHADQDFTGFRIGRRDE